HLRGLTITGRHHRARSYTLHRFASASSSGRAMAGDRGSDFTVAAAFSGAVITVTGINQEPIGRWCWPAASVSVSDLPAQILFLFPEIQIASIPDSTWEDRIRVIRATRPSSVRLLFQEPRRRPASRLSAQRLPPGYRRTNASLNLKRRATVARLAADGAAQIS